MKVSKNFCVAAAIVVAVLLVVVVFDLTGFIWEAIWKTISDLLSILGWSAETVIAGETSGGGG